MVSERLSPPYSPASLGRALRVARKARRLRLEDVASDVAIPLRHLQALEAGDFSVFAADVYARGAYVRYATHLGLNTTTSLPSLWQALSEAHVSVPLRLLTPRSWISRVMTPRWLFAIGGSITVVMVGSYIAWQVQSFLRLPHLTVTEPVAAVVQDESVMVRGQAETTATVTVNGEPLLLEADGQFAALVRLHPGINHIQVEARSASRRSRVIEKDLLVPRG